MAWDNFMLRKNDPLNIHQSILRHLRVMRRDSITSVEDLCRVIISTCLNAFDHHATPDEYHFFDFIEHAIGQVVSHPWELLKSALLLIAVRWIKLQSAFKNFDWH